MTNGKRAPRRVVLIVAGAAAISICAGIGVTAILTSNPDSLGPPTQSAPLTVTPTRIAPSATLHAASATVAATTYTAQLQCPLPSPSATH